ncbi:MAG: type II toxin-antitoxin system Phd/YefM family antitoxin [Methyloversatilis sp.]|nr:type II toxin-antitoxin system Phd/YefM family antitoxin [Methyloversatilis sp.]MDP3456746.1 type II toxin-antitoxin system Phd/YefM family antitoxin [Methyloversatilis sp.]MDP3576982.1 type II toxin-antitoxin system Phd/YefM family antitoxin [Methyloversatilis sp.]
MHSVSLRQARVTLSQLITAIELREEREIVIVRDGRPVARLVPVAALHAGPRLGVAKGLFEVSVDIDAQNDNVKRLFWLGSDS